MSIFTTANTELGFIRESRDDNFIDIELSKKQQSSSPMDMDNFEQIIIDTCGSISNILESLNSLAFDYTDAQNVTIIKFKNVTFEAPINSDEFDLVANKWLGKSIVLLIAAENDDDFMIYWKSSEIDYFLSFKPYNSSEIEANKTLFQFIVKFLANSLKQNHLGE